jgi:hypothetical protein
MKETISLRNATVYYWDWNRDMSDSWLSNLKELETQYWIWKLSEDFEFDLLKNTDSRLDMTKSPIDTYVWDFPENKKEMRGLQKEIKEFVKKGKQ